MTVALAHAKLNLALVVGPVRADGKHEVVTVMQSIGLADEIELEPASATVVTGFDDSIVGAALEALAHAAGIAGGWHVRLTKRIPVAAGLGGGSADAATALRLANAFLSAPLPPARLSAVAAAIGADVPFFLAGGTQLATADGTTLARVELPVDYDVLVVLPHGATKESTAAVYRAFDERDGAQGFDERRRALLAAVREVEHVADLARFPPNDLARSDLTGRLRALGAVRADVSGAGPCVYGIFDEPAAAANAARVLRSEASTWATAPVGPDPPAV